MQRSILSLHVILRLGESKQLLYELMLSITFVGTARAVASRLAQGLGEMVRGTEFRIADFLEGSPSSVSWKVGDEIV